MTTKKNKILSVCGKDEQGRRISSKDFEVEIREATVSAEELHIESFGQHNIGLRLGNTAQPVTLKIHGPIGQRLGCMGLPGLTIICDGSVSDDVGYLNIGADIIVRGDATNGACNAMAGGRVMIGGSIGARGLTMTKWNPEYTPPEMWVLGSVGDTFAEFNCGGIAVVCGVHAKNPATILGYRPCVGMVGGKIFFRGAIDETYSKNDAKLTTLDDGEWQWLVSRLPEFLHAIEHADLQTELNQREQWRLLSVLSPQERSLRSVAPMSMELFRRQIWSKGFGGGDPLRDLAPTLDRSPIGLIEPGELRRKKPFWVNRQAAAPCTFYCPIHIPTIDRLRLLREGRTQEAYEMLLRYTPLPASVCGAICPNFCIQNCSRGKVDYTIDVSVLGRAVQASELPQALPPTGKRVAIIGGGPAGMSLAWHLALNGVEAHIFERATKLGGKLGQTIPWDRLPRAVWEEELARFAKMPNISVHLHCAISKEQVERLKSDFNQVVIAVGTHQPRSLAFLGHERVIFALDYLKTAKSETPMETGKEVIIIGAGNVGCDVAVEAYHLGASQVVLVDIQQPQAFGKERAAAEALGAVFRWPVLIQEVNEAGLITADGSLIPAQTVIASIGDIPALSFLPDSVEVVHAAGGTWIKTDEAGQTSDPQILAIGDVERPGLATNALGAGKRSAEYLIASFKKEAWHPFNQPLIPTKSLTLGHYDPVVARGTTEMAQAERCLSCGSCRDCHLCAKVCPVQAISRVEVPTETGYEYVSDDAKCIGCGFCADTCPCGIWVLRPC